MTHDISTRDQIINAADQLFYQQGYAYTSFADIANSVQISRGNFYYHFKKKDQILTEVIHTRIANTRNMLEKWESDADNPRDRIRSFIFILIANRKKIKQHGCPVGTLCTELAKLNHASQDEANKIFTLFRVWLREQFERLGFTRDADELAMQLLARSQGVATLASAFCSEKFLEQEVHQMCLWLDRCINNQSGPG